MNYTLQNLSVLFDTWKPTIQTIFISHKNAFALTEINLKQSIYFLNKTNKFFIFNKKLSELTKEKETENINEFGIFVREILKCRIIVVSN